MSTKFWKNVWAVSLATVVFSSCSFGSKDLGMASDESIAKIKEVVKANVDHEVYKIYRLTWKEDDGNRKLDNVLSRINVLYLDKEDNSYDRWIVLKKGKFVAEEARKSDRAAFHSYKLTTPLDIEGLNAETIRQLLVEGNDLLSSQEEGDQYELKSVESIDFSISAVPKDYEDRWDTWDDNYKARYRQVQQSFELNFTRKDEREEVRGKRIWTNYYTIPFVVNEAGKVEMGH